MLRAVIFDVDDVVIDTDLAGAAAERSVAGPLAPHLGEAKALEVSRGLSAGYDILRRNLRRAEGEVIPEYARHEARIRGWQRAILSAGYELKLWSRDSLLAIAFEDAGVPVSGELLQLASDEYWKVCAEKTILMEDARRIISVLRARGVAVHLATNSDGFLRWDRSSNGFSYDPAWAVERKLARLGVLTELGLGAPDVSVGDPIGKPKTAFYEKVLAELSAKLGTPIAAHEVIGVGDSLINDVLPLLALGAPAGAWLVRAELGRAPVRMTDHPGVTRIGSLDDLAAVLV